MNNSKKKTMYTKMYINLIFKFYRFIIFKMSVVHRNTFSMLMKFSQQLCKINYQLLQTIVINRKITNKFVMVIYFTIYIICLIR